MEGHDWRHHTSERSKRSCQADNWSTLVDSSNANRHLRRQRRNSFRCPARYLASRCGHFGVKTPERHSFCFDRLLRLTPFYTFTEQCLQSWRSLRPRKNIHTRANSCGGCAGLLRPSVEPRWLTVWSCELGHATKRARPRRCHTGVRDSRPPRPVEDSLFVWQTGLTMNGLFACLPKLAMPPRCIVKRTVVINWKS